VVAKDCATPDVRSLLAANAQLQVQSLTCGSVPQLRACPGVPQKMGSTSESGEGYGDNSLPHIRLLNAPATSCQALPTSTCTWGMRAAQEKHSVLDFG